MRLVLSRIPRLTGFARGMAWRPLVQPDAELTQVLEFQLAFVAGTVVLILWAALTPLAGPAPDPASIVVAWIVVLPLHELTHAAAFPKSFRSPQLCIIAWPLSVHWDGAISRNRYLTILAAPQIVITLAPIMAAVVIGEAATPIALISILNALASGGDFLAIILVLAQVPPGASVGRDGDATEWNAID